MNKPLLMQQMIESGQIPSKSVAGLYTQVLTTLTRQVAANASSDAETSTQVSTNTSKINTLTSDVSTLNTAVEASTAKIEANEAAISTAQSDILNNKTAIEQTQVTVSANTTAIQSVDAKADGIQTQLNDLSDTAATKDSVTAVAADVSSVSTDLSNYKTATDAALDTATEDITDLKSAVSSLETLKADVEAVNANAQLINEHAAEYQDLKATVEGIQSIKADVELVQEAKAEIQTNLTNISANTTAITALTTRTTNNETAITNLTNANTALSASISGVDQSLSDYKTTTDATLDDHTTDIAGLKTVTDGHTELITENRTDIQQLQQDVIAAKNTADSAVSGLSSKASAADLAAVSVVASAAQSTAAANATAIANHDSAIGGLQDTVADKVSTTDLNTTLADYAKTEDLEEYAKTADVPSVEGLASEAYVDEKTAAVAAQIPDVTPFVAKTALNGLVSIDGVNTPKVEHTIKTTKSGKVNTARIWNESDGGGVQFDSRSNQTLSFVGCNDGSDDIDVQIYAKHSYDDKTTPGHNVGARIAVSVNGAFYTNGKANGSYNPVTDEIVTKKDLPDMDALATKTEVSAVNDKVDAIEVPDISGLATEAYVDSKVAAITIPSVEGLASTDYVDGKVSGLATESYVDSKVAAITHPTEGLATTEYVDEKVAAVDIPDVSGFATKEELQTAVEGITHPVDGLATESYVDDKVAAITVPDVSNFLTTSDLSGLVAAKGTNVATAKHVIASTKNGKTDQSIIWNETSGGGVQFNSRSNQTLSFVGVNNGDDDIDVQIYAKKFFDNTATEGHNVGARLNVSTSGIYYTNGKANGSYTVNDEIVTKAVMSDSIADKLTASQLSGLVSVNGTTVSSAEHSIVTKKNNKNITAKIWNETSGGGAQMKNENVGKISFIGVNNGDGDNEIWVQGYAKNIADNIGTRLTLSTTGMYYTKNQANGTYTASDEIITKKMVSGLVALEGTNVSSAAHEIVTTVNNKTITSRIWNEASGGGAQMVNLNADKMSFVGVNNGDGDNEIWVQQYAKVKSTNVGARTTLSTTGFFYTKNKANGTYTENDEVLTKNDYNALLAIINTQADTISALTARVAALEAGNGTTDAG